MAFAWPLAVRDRMPRSFTRSNNNKWLRAAIPAALVCAGALLLSPPWKATRPSVAPTATHAPELPLSADGGASTLVGALLVIGGALAALPLILSRIAPRTRAGGQIDLVEVRPLGGKKSLMLVQVGRRRFLVGACDQGLSTLAELDAAANFADVAAAARAQEGASA